MKKALFVFLLLIPYTAQGAEKKHNSVEIGVAYLEQSSALNTWSSNKRIESLSAEPATTSKVLPLILFDLNVGYGEDNSIYLKTPITEFENIGISLGTEYRLKDNAGLLDFSFFYSPFLDAWKNPYETGDDREDTGVKRHGVKLGVKGILDTGLSSSLKVARIDVEDDQIGEIFSTLKRDGNIYTVSVGYDFTLKPSFRLNPELSIRRGYFEGESNSFCAYGGSLRLIYITGRFTLMPYLFYSMSRYDEAHPLFEKKRDERSYGAILMATLSHPFGLQDYSIRLILRYSKRNSDITFFDASAKFTGITIGYQFWQGNGVALAMLSGGAQPVFLIPASSLGTLSRATKVSSSEL